MSDERATAMIDKSKSYMYDELIMDENSIFHNHTKTDVFILSSAIGYYFKNRVPLPTPSSEKQDLFVTTTLGGGSVDKIWIMKSIALAQTDITILKSMREVVKICQEFANFGIDYIYKVHKESDNEVSELANMMADALESQ